MFEAMMFGDSGPWQKLSSHWCDHIASSSMILLPSLTQEEAMKIWRYSKVFSSC